MYQLQRNRLLRTVMGLILCERRHENKILKCKNYKWCSDSASRSTSLPLSTPPQNAPKLSSALSRGPTQLVSELLQHWQPNTCQSPAGPEPLQSPPYNADLSHIKHHFASHLRNMCLWASILFQRKLFPSYKAAAVCRDIIYPPVCYWKCSVLLRWHQKRNKTTQKLLAIQNTNSNNVSNEESIGE